MKGEYTFVELSKGTMEDVSYNNVTLSNGIRAAVLKNETNQDDLLKTFKEGDKVKAELDVKIVKGPNRTSVFAVTLAHIEKLGGTK